MSASRWERLGPLAPLLAQPPALVRVGGWRVALFSWEGALYALDDRCPHQGAPLSQGHLSEDGFVECPAHCWEYHVPSGQGRRAHEGCALSFPVEVRGEEAWISLPLQAPAYPSEPDEEELSWED